MCSDLILAPLFVEKNRLEAVDQLKVVLDHLDFYEHSSRALNLFQITKGTGTVCSLQMFSDIEEVSVWPVAAVKVSCSRLT